MDAATATAALADLCGVFVVTRDGGWIRLAKDTEVSGVVSAPPSGRFEVSPELRGSPLAEAARRAVQEMVKWIVASTELSVNDANMLVSLVGDVQICQIVDPLMTCRMDMPSNILAQIGIALPESGP